MDITNSLKKYIFFSGIAFLLLAVVVILCDALTGAGEESSLEERQSGTAFWVGLPYLFLGFLMLYLGRKQENFNIKACRICSIICFILSLLAVVFEGPDWNYYVNYNNYVCKNGDSKLCTKTRNLSGLFGSITVAAIIATLFCISNILVCNWILFRMSVETPEEDFDRSNVKRTALSTQTKEDGDDFFRTQGYHTCWNDGENPVEVTSREVAKKKRKDSFTQRKTS